MRKITIILFILLQTTIISAQDNWSLQDCIDYAVENNIALKRQQIQTETYRADRKLSKANLLPNLNFSSQANMNFGRSVDPVTNTITFNQNIGNSFSIGSGVTVFNGFALMNRVSAAKFLYMMGVELQEQQEDLILLDIINAYYEILMARGVVQTATDQLKVAEQQLHRVEVLVRTGSENRTTLLEMQSQVSGDRLLLTQAVNNASIGLEKLRSLLQLEPGVDFNVEDRLVPPTVIDNQTNNSADSIYSVAQDILPVINALDYKMIARKKELKAAIGEATPKLSLYAGWSTGYFDAKMEGVETTPYLDQLKNNNSQYVQASISIPIFNRWYNGRNINRARLNLEDTQLELEQEKNSLYQQINSACLELEAINDEYLAAKDNFEFSTQTFNAIEKKFQLGMANATEYSEARRQRFSAEVNLLKAELQYELKSMTINFFLTGEWTN